MAPRIVFEDEFVTEYADGSTECRFTDEQWAIMLSDPKFGYVCNGPSRHRMSDADHRYGACLACEGEAEAAWGEWCEENLVWDEATGDYVEATPELITARDARTAAWAAEDAARRAAEEARRIAEWGDTEPF